MTKQKKKRLFQGFQDSNRSQTRLKPDLPCLNGRMSNQVIIFLVVVWIYQVPSPTSEACYSFLVGFIANDDQ